MIADMDALYRQHSGYICRAIRTILRDPRDIEDVSQETWLKAWRHIGAFEGRSGIRTWLCCIARREALTLLRKARTRRMDRMVGLDDHSRDDPNTYSPAERLIDSRTDSEQSTREREWMGRIRALPRQYRAVMLAHLDGDRDNETADEMGMNRKTFRVSLLRSREKLRSERC